MPKESIRFRIIANSNNINDQLTKQQIKKELITNYIPNILNSTNIEESRKNIKEELKNIDNYLKNNNIEYSINFGNNYFPKKELNGITYDQGNYESLVITLGKGLGDNWWCVLYPPLCLIEKNNTNDINFKSYIKERIDKYN